MVVRAALSSPAQTESAAEVQGRPMAALAVLVVFLDPWMVVVVEMVVDLILVVLAIVEV